MNAIVLFDAARERLAGAPREALGELISPRRVLGIARAERIVRRGAAWHLGVLLLGDDAVLATGDVVRARHEARRGYAAESQRRRAELGAAARRGGFAEGEIVHIGWRLLDLAILGEEAVRAPNRRPGPEAVPPDQRLRDEASGPLAVIDGVPSVRWSAAGGYMTLERYLDERIALLREPPRGA